MLQVYSIYDLFMITACKGKHNKSTSSIISIDWTTLYI